MKKKAYKLVLALWKDFTTKRVMASASRLTYSTLLSTVPILAVVFAVARGFGFSIYIEQWFRHLLEAQPQACEIIIGFVNSYLIHTKKGLFLGIGLIFMLWTVLMLIANIEETFNDIWLVKKGRSVFRTFTDYIAMLFAFPIVIVVSSGLSIWVSALNHHFSDNVVLGPMMTFFIELSPYLLMSATFVCLYMFMPNTKVHFKSALLPGILAGLAMQLFQVLYINSQIWLSSYNAIYGTFAVLPLLMLWIQVSWTIILVGAELSFTIQNREDFLIEASYDKLSYNQRMKYTTLIMSLICKRFESGERAYTAIELKEQTHISMRIISAILYDLHNIHFITETLCDEKSEEISYQPAETLQNITFGEMVSRLNKLNKNTSGDATKTKEEIVTCTAMWDDIERKTVQYLDTMREIRLSDFRN